MESDVNTSMSLDELKSIYNSGGLPIMFPDDGNKKRKTVATIVVADAVAVVAADAVAVIAAPVPTGRTGRQADMASAAATRVRLGYLMPAHRYSPEKGQKRQKVGRKLAGVGAAVGAKR
jgi:hypothetical protein